MFNKQVKILYMQVKSPKCTFPIGFLTVCLFLFTGCNYRISEDEENEKATLPIEKNIVETVVINRQDFTQEIISNGKLVTKQKAELYFKNIGVIDAIHFKNGNQVSSGTILASLQKDEYVFALRKAEVAMETAEVDKLDALLSMGYKSLDAEIPPEHVKIANIRSSYSQALIQLEEAKNKLESVSLKAPFSGKVEGLKQKPYEQVNSSEPFCTIINDKLFTIEFSLLETEINQVSLGQTVKVFPIATEKSSTGRITEINPRIDENGLVKVYAEVNNPGQYMEGMNVKVSISKVVPEQLVVPRKAVVLRQNKEVLFRYTNGIAYWTYIRILDENENSYSVEAVEGATLHSGDTVIVSNNLNLAHESEVEME